MTRRQGVQKEGDDIKVDLKKNPFDKLIDLGRNLGRCTEKPQKPLSLSNHFSENFKKIKMIKNCFGCKNDI